MSKPVIVIGSYDNKMWAELDYEHLAGNTRELWTERVYAIGLVERGAEGDVKVVNHLEPDTNVGTISGAVVGGLLGLLVPTFIVFTAAAGAGAGRALTHLWHGVSRRDLSELGSAIDVGEGAVLVVAAKAPDDLQVVLPHASRLVHREMSHKHEDVEALITELRELHDAPSDLSADQPAQP